VFLLAIPGVVIRAAIVALVLSATTALTFTEAFLVGSMVAATDPAGGPLESSGGCASRRRLVTIGRDGEPRERRDGDRALRPGPRDVGRRRLARTDRRSRSSSAWSARVVLGIALGMLAARIVRGVDEHLTELTLTVVLAYGTYLVADALGLSGVIATLFAAGVFGTKARPALTKRTIETIDDVWEFVAFLLTAAVFLLVGLAITPATLVLAAGPIVWGVVAILVAGRSSCMGSWAGSPRWRPAPGMRRSDFPARGSTSSSGPASVAPCPSPWRCHSPPGSPTAT